MKGGHLRSRELCKHSEIDTNLELKYVKLIKQNMDQNSHYFVLAACKIYTCGVGMKGSQFPSICIEVSVPRKG
jgi:hypothetical protein